MAKKRIPVNKKKPLRRTSTMTAVIAEGEQFLAETKKKKPTRTRTMAETIKEGQKIITSRIKRQPKKQSRSQSVQSDTKSKGKKQKKITKTLASNERKNGKSTQADKEGKKSSSKKINNTKPVPAPTSNHANVKKTIFKTKSKDHLPIPAFGFIDVCFCIDATGSMCGQLAQAQSTILSIISNIQQKVRTEGLTLRFAVVSYRDHPPQQSTYVIKGLDFTDGHQAGQYVKKLEAFGGGDFPEAVHDGLIHCCKNMNWVQLSGTPILRYIFHIADAPPHGKQFGNVCQKQGCLCGIKTKDVFHEINKRQIHYRLIKARAGGQLNLMEDIFKKGIVDFQSVDLSHAKQMDVKVSDMIIQEVVPDGY